LTRKPTIYDVALEAGVSISTVSLALNNPGRVSAATLARVMGVIDSLGFVPNSDAVSRARRGVRRIGVVAPFTSYRSFARRLSGILRAAAADQYEVVVYDQESAATSRLVSLPVTGQVDGLIVLSVPFSDDVALRLTEQRLPTTLVEFRRPGFSSVTIDDAAGGRLAAELLIRHGHTQVGFLGAVQRVEYLSQSQLRLDGFRDALSRPPDVRLVAEGFESARAGARELLLAGSTAIFAHTDLLASAALRAARDLSLAVPDEIEVIGFDDDELAEPLGLTTVRQPLEESGEVAAELLFAQIDQPGRSARNITLELSLIERDTTAASPDARVSTHADLFAR
jgi:DNA-binding LacI/PurR family transcriptional regulator